MLTAEDTAAQTSADQRTQADQKQSAVSAEQLSDNPQNYYGKTVTLREEVEEVLGPHVFTLDDAEFLSISPTYSSLLRMPSSAKSK
jgi:hypothetical protein